MVYFLMVIAIPVIVALGAKLYWPHHITWQELGISLLISAAIGGAVVAAGYHRDFADTEVISGQVTGKAKVRVSCSHSYQCYCYTTCSGYGKSRSCSRHCSTCYEHSNDWDWDVFTNIGTMTIDRVDRRGSNEPHRWSIVMNGDPVARPHYYKNWIKGSPESLFHAMDVYGLEKTIPAYPKFYDYYKIDRVIPTGGMKIPELRQWNDDLSAIMRELGPKKQANVIVIFTKKDRMFVEALRTKWLGGKKNDVILIVGSKNYPKIDWVDVVSWTDSFIFKVKLRDEIRDLKNIDRNAFMTTIRKNVNTFYVRKPIKDFEYLEDAIKPPVWVLILGFILSLLTSIGMSWYTYVNEIGSVRYRHYNRYKR